MSRKAHSPTDQTRSQVSALASFGVPQDDIAAYIDIDPKTLRKHYRRELDTAETRANAAVAKRLYEQATGDSVPAAIFWLKARAGWREKVELDHTSSDGSMAPKPTTIQLVAPDVDSEA